MNPQLHQQCQCLNFRWHTAAGLSRYANREAIFSIDFTDEENCVSIVSWLVQSTGFRPLSNVRLSPTAHEYVAGAADRLQDLWLIRVAFDFSAQAHDSKVDAAVEHAGRFGYEPCSSNCCRLSTRSGCSAKTRSRSNSVLVRGVSLPLRVIQPMRSQIENASSHFHHLRLVASKHPARLAVDRASAAAGS